MKSGETIAVVTDLSTRREYVHVGFRRRGGHRRDVYELCVNLIPGWTKVGIPTIGRCKGTVEALKAADMV